MKKIMIATFVMLILLSNFSSAETNNDVVFVNRMIISNSETDLPFNSIDPGVNQQIITNKDDIFLYYASIGVVNPTKKKYKVEIIFVDKNNNVVLQGGFKRELTSVSRRDVGKDIIKTTLLTVMLDPKVGTIAPGQLISLQDRQEYFVKLLIENKLVGISRFMYIIEK